MKNLNKSLIAGALIGAAFNSMAGDTITPTVGFTTLPDITLNELQAVNFGTVLKLTNGATCIFDIDGTTHSLSDATIRAATGDVATPAGAGDVGTLTGDCATGLDFTAGAVAQATIAEKGIEYGLYEIVAEAGADVTVVLTGIDSTELQYEPSGYGIDAGVGEVVLDDNATGYDLTTPSVASATSTAGVLRIAIGGTITNLQALDPDSSYSAGLQIDVNY